MYESVLDESSSVLDSISDSVSDSVVDSEADSIDDDSEVTRVTSEEDLSSIELAVTPISDSSIVDVSDVDRPLAAAGEEVAVPVVVIDTLIDLISKHNDSEDETNEQLVENVSQLNTRVSEIEMIGMFLFLTTFVVIGVVLAVKFSRWFFRFF